jgi:hypothetical protein
MRLEDILRHFNGPDTSSRTEIEDSSRIRSNGGTGQGTANGKTVDVVIL